MIVSVFSSSQAAAVPTEGLQNWGSKQYLLQYHRLLQIILDVKFQPAEMFFCMGLLDNSFTFLKCTLIQKFQSFYLMPNKDIQYHSRFSAKIDSSCFSFELALWELFEYIMDLQQNKTDLWKTSFYFLLHPIIHDLLLLVIEGLNLPPPPDRNRATLSTKILGGGTISPLSPWSRRPQSGIIILYVRRLVICT